MMIQSHTGTLRRARVQVHAGCAPHLHYPTIAWAHCPAVGHIKAEPSSMETKGCCSGTTSLRAVVGS